MDSLQAGMMGILNRGKPMKIFDWHKAARLIREQNPSRVRAGLRNDWEYTGGVIYENDQPVPKDDTYVYLSSNWAIPEIELDGAIEECYVMENDVPEGEEWDSDTYWPESALDILNAEDDKDKE